MEEDKFKKLVDAVVYTAAAMNLHPYAVINNLASMLPDENQRKKYISDMQAELTKIAHTLPWSL